LDVPGNGNYPILIFHGTMETEYAFGQKEVAFFFKLAGGQLKIKSQPGAVDIFQFIDFANHWHNGISSLLTE